MHSYGITPPAFRLPDGTHVGRVRLQVADLQRSIDFYQHVLGLQVHDRTESTARLGSPDPNEPLVELQEQTGIRPAPRRGAYGLYHFAILLPTRAALGRFIGHLAGLGLRFGAADHWVSEAIYLNDPDGLGIEVYADRPREDWEVNGKELAMATETLDLESLMAAGGGESWHGAPAGTAMGHIHLHVGNIELGERYYHDALGFDKIVWSYPGALFLSAGGYHHHLGTNTWAPGPAAADDQAHLMEWALVVPTDADAARAADSLRTGGYETNEDAGSWVSRDPWGTRVRIMPASQS